MGIKPVLEKAEKQGFGLTFDDVLIKPRMSKVVPSKVSLETMLSSNIPLHIPLVSADMDSVTEEEMARELAMQGGIGFLWKHPFATQQAQWVKNVKLTLNAKIDTPVSINQNKELKDVRKTLSRYNNRFSTLIVVDDNKRVVGLVTGHRTQFAREGQAVREFMLKNPVTSQEDFDFKGAYDFMRKERIGKLILVDSNKRLKGLYCFSDVKSLIEGINPLYNRDRRGQLRVGANVGVCTRENSGEFDNRVEKLLRNRCDVLLVGTAHGHSENVINTVKHLKTNFTKHKFDLVAGNVATYEGAKDLFEAGADTVKVGVGPGSICTTRVISGCGVPQITAIYESAKAASEEEKHIIADGGIRYSGDITKALGAGAHSVMLGSLFAATEESPGKIEHFEGGQRYKTYRGMGSLSAMKDLNMIGDRYAQVTQDKGKVVPEGVEGRVPLVGKVGGVVYQLVGGLRSGMGYVGAKNIKELHSLAEFIRVSGAGSREGHPHDITITEETPNYPVRLRDEGKRS
jgi:IMP dehydrogenase